MNRCYKYYVTGLFSLAGLSCAKNKSDATNTSSTQSNSPQAGQVAFESNPLAESYPDGLAVTAFATTDDTEATASAGTLAIQYEDATLRLTQAASPSETTRLLQQQPPPPGQPMSQPGSPTAGSATPNQCYNSYEEALAERTAVTPFKPEARRPVRLEAAAAKDRINGKAESCVSEEFTKSLAIMREAMEETGKNLDGYGDCFLPDWGIVQGFYPGSDDVCLVGYARAQLTKLSAYVDFTKGLTEAMLCQALKGGVFTADDKEIAEGRSLDLTPQLVDALKDLPGAPTISLAKVTRATGGRRFQTEFVIATKARFANAEASVPLTINIDHEPSDSTNTTYTGLIRLSYEGKSRNYSGTIALSLNYSRAVDTSGNRVKYELRSGFFGTAKSPFDSRGILDFNAEGIDETDNKNLNSMNYVSYDGYPELDVAKLSYWVNFGARYEEAARGMVFDIKRANGEVKGCAVAGSAGDIRNGLSIRRSLDEGYALLPKSYMRPFMCDESARGGEKMWLQCFVRDQDGAYVPDQTLIDDVATGYDFVASSVVKGKVPSLVYVPRAPGYSAEKQQCSDQNFCPR